MAHIFQNLWHHLRYFLNGKRTMNSKVHFLQVYWKVPAAQLLLLMEASSIITVLHRNFADSYEWRKNTLPSNSINCVYIPSSLRVLWPSKVNISFGLYDKPFGGANMDESIMETILTKTLNQ